MPDIPQLALTSPFTKPLNVRVPIRRALQPMLWRVWATVNHFLSYFSKFLPISLEHVKQLKSLLGPRFELCHKFRKPGEEAKKLVTLIGQRSKSGAQNRQAMGHAGT